MAQDRPSLNPLLTWLWQLLSLYSSEEITVPTDYHERVYQVKDVLKSDTSGLINSVLDFAIHCASVDYIIETNNNNFSNIIKYWFENINRSLLGRVPIGVKALSKECYMERWKNSSFLVLRTIWEDVSVAGTQFNLPTKMWFVDGYNLVVKNGDDGARIIGTEKYSIKIDERRTRPIPSSRDELIFVQKPFNSWSDLYTNPFIIQRGLYKNLKLFNLVNKKAERIVGKALEYLLLLKKGTEQLALKGLPEYTYSEEDLKKAKESLTDMVNKSKTDAGVPIYATGFDTEMEHLIPEYARILQKDIYSTIEKRILAGLGLIEIIEGTTSSRREALLSPKPFITEVESGIEDFISLLNDVIQTIIDKNKENHPKYFGESSTISLHYAPIKTFITDSIRDHLRSMYDRGVISKQTYTEVIGNVDIDIEVNRRKQETDNDLDTILYPPIIQNTEAKFADLTPFKKEKKTVEKQPEEKTGPEAKNFKSSVEEVPEPYEGIEDDLEFVKSLEEFGKIVKRKDGWYVLSEKTGKSLGGPYKTYKKAVQRLRQVEFFKNKGSEVSLDEV